MKTTTKNIVSASVAAVMMGGASLAHAADSVNVAFFLEWATPNQIAKVDKAYDDAMGVDVKWTNFSTGVQMTEAMLAGDIDIAYSQGLAPFVTAIQQGAPIKMVSVAVIYEANDCFVKNGLGINSSNASELEGRTVAVPLNTMADFAFPTAAEQKEQFFGSDGVAVAAAESLGLVFKKPGAWNVDQKISKVITGEYLD